MNFFKSVFSDDPDPPNPESEPGSHNNPDEQEDADPNPKSPPTQQSDPNPSGGGGWMFGDLMKTLATKSESVIETYRRDLQEFGSGLKKEIEVAHGSLETVSHVIDEFGNTVLKGTAQIISQGTDAILAPDQESDSSDTNSQSLSSQQGLGSKRYSRFDVQIRAIQGDASTYCEEPEDLDDYNKWNLGFVLGEKSEEIEGLFEENGAIESIYKRVVPNSVDHETFWRRYFYRVYKLRQAENVRVNLVKRAISIEEDEELSWDVDDDEYNENGSNVVSKKENSEGSSEVAAENSGKVGKIEDGEKSSSNVGDVSNAGEEANAANRELVSKDSEHKNVKEESSSFEESQVVGTSSVVDEKDSAVKLSGDEDSEEKVHVEGDSGKKDLPSKSEEKVALEGKNEALEWGQDMDVSVVSLRSSMPEEEDLGWDEIEDLSSIDDKKVSHGGSASPNKPELRKRVSAAEEEEDLSWDIEDDDDGDEPAKA